MNLQKLFLTENNCYKTGAKLKPTGIMVHSTGVDNADLKRYVGPDDGLLGKNTGNNHWNCPTPDGRSVCVHAFIGKLANGEIATYQTLPWEMRGWHAGNDKGNNTYIGFEICEDKKDTKGYFEKVYKEAVELTAMLCKTYNIKPEKPHLICHSEGYTLGVASNHADVMHWFKEQKTDMDKFRADVAKEMSNTTTPTYPVLRKGDKGDAVKTMQSKLNEFGSNLVADGIFGTGTETALKDFQTKNGLTADGICGAKTWDALNKPQTPPVKTPEEISIENAVTDGAITDTTYWLNALNGKTTVNKENLKILIDTYHEVYVNKKATSGNSIFTSIRKLFVREK
jgi:N-acetylmuramoyl-L-alanine amidase